MRRRPATRTVIVAAILLTLGVALAAGRVSGGTAAPRVRAPAATPATYLPTPCMRITVPGPVKDSEIKCP